MKESPADRLQKLRIEAGFTGPVEAANHFGWNRNTYKSHENGVRGIREPAARRYAEGYSRRLKRTVSHVWLLTGTDPAELLSPDEADLLAEYRALDDGTRRTALALIRTLIQSGKPAA